MASYREKKAAKSGLPVGYLLLYCCFTSTAKDMSGRSVNLGRLRLLKPLTSNWQLPVLKVSNPGFLALELDALPTALRGPAPLAIKLLIVPPFFSLMMSGKFCLLSTRNPRNCLSGIGDADREISMYTYPIRGSRLPIQRSQVRCLLSSPVVRMKLSNPNVPDAESSLYYKVYNSR